MIKAAPSHTDIVEIPAPNVCAYHHLLLARRVKVQCHVYNRLAWLYTAAAGNNIIFTPTDPTFKPRNVSAWPLSDGSVHIQWTFNATEHLRALERANLRLSNITLSINEANSGSLVMTDYVPINYQRCVE